MKVAIIDIDYGNIGSLSHAFVRLGAEVIVTAEHDEISRADRVVLPGVGAAGHAMDAIYARNLAPVITALHQPLIGVCLGMQLLYSSSGEGEDSDNNPLPLLNVIDGNVEKLPDDPSFPVPHMGWNEITPVAPSPLWPKETEWDDTYAYFANSFVCPQTEATTATTSHGNRFAVMMQHKNFYGCQFHPERSGQFGARILQRFMEVEA